ncbi:MAG TPA: lytic transglycosylase domain-containing protein, partial [Longimicrobium sp.]|nr:lytic transglycosylase domain-containing protein [Longimicrobium sp.]
MLDPNESPSPRRVTRRAAPLRNDFRSLARSRPVQALLLSVAVAQVVVTATGTGPTGADGKTRQGVVQSALSDAALRMSPVQAKAPLPESAEALAVEYRAKGYTVPDDLAAKIYEAAVRHEIDPSIAFGLVRTESEFKDYATSRVGAVGLTQLMVPTARWFKRDATVADLRDSETNLEIGFRYLNELIDRYEGNVELALTAYNRGTGTVDRVLERGGDP